MSGHSAILASWIKQRIHRWRQAFTVAQKLVRFYLHGTFGTDMWEGLRVSIFLGFGEEDWRSNFYFFLGGGGLLVRFDIDRSIDGVNPIHG